MGLGEVLKAMDHFGGICTTQDVIKFTGDVWNSSKYLCFLRKRGEIDSIDSCLHQGIGNRPKIWIKYYDFET